MYDMTEADNVKFWRFHFDEGWEQNQSIYVWNKSFLVFSELCY